MSRFKIVCGAVTAALMLSGSGAARAEGGESRGDRIAAIRDAKVALPEAIAIAERMSGARVAKIELDREEGVFAYEISAVSNEGKVKLLLDTTTGKVLRNERKNASGKDRAAVARLASSRTTLAQAVEAAERKGAGKAVAAAFEDHRDGSGVFEVDVAANDAIQRFRIDAASGQVVDARAAKKDHEDEDDDD